MSDTNFVKALMPVLSKEPVDNIGVVDVDTAREMICPYLPGKNGKPANCVAARCMAWESQNKINGHSITGKCARAHGGTHERALNAYALNQISETIMYVGEKLENLSDDDNWPLHQINDDDDGNEPVN